MTDELVDWSTGRSRRLSGEAVREMVLDAAQEALSDTGLTVSLDHLNMEELIRRVGVPRTSAFKEFGGKDGLITALIERMVNPNEAQGAAYSPTTIEVSEQVIRANAHRLGTADGRYQVMCEAIRLGARQNYEDIISSPYWKTYMALSVSLPGLEPTRRERALSSLRVVESRFIDTMSSFYDRMLPVVGRRVVEGTDTRQLAAAGSAVVEGVAQRRFVNPDLVDKLVFRPGLDGKPVEWHLAAIGFLGVVEGMTVADSPSR